MLKGQDTACFTRTWHFISRCAILLDHMCVCVCCEGRGAIVVVVSGSPGSARPVGGEAKKSPQQLGIMFQI